MQDIYFLVDGTLSNDAVPFCQEMYAIELITEVINPGSDMNGPRIAAYHYPLKINSPEGDMRFFKPGVNGCVQTVEDFHRLMLAVSLGTRNDIRDKVLGGATYPERVLELVAKDIQAEIASGVSRNRRRVVIIITDGDSDGNLEDLRAAIKKLSNAGDRTTLISAGIGTESSTSNIAGFREELEVLANGDPKNAVLVFDSTTSVGTKLGLKLVNLMEKNGAICKDQGNF